MSVKHDWYDYTEGGPSTCRLCFCDDDDPEASQPCSPDSKEGRARWLARRRLLASAVVAQATIDAAVMAAEGRGREAAAHVVGARASAATMLAEPPPWVSTGDAITVVKK